MRIPLDRIDPHAFLRDRTIIDPDALAELQAAIAASGLRNPVEVCERGDRYALISGYRRMKAVSRLHAATGDRRWAKIDAVVRDAPSTAAALAQMVEENEVRQPLSAWERARVAVAATAAGTFDNLDAALRVLYPYAARQKRARLRAAAEVVEALDGRLTDPETLTERALLRISGALRLGWGKLIEAALDGPEGAAAQWQALRPVLEEAETLVAEGRPTTPHRPRRLCHPAPGLTVRREKTRHGFVLHLTGRRATEALVAEVLDEVERWLGKG